MKKKIIVASTIGLLGITSMVVSTFTFAGNTKIGWHKIWSGINIMGSWCSCGPMIWSGMHRWSGLNMMQFFASTWDAQAYRTAVEKATTNNDYTAYVAANTKYSITKYMTKDEFAKMVTERATQEKIKTALLNWEYTTWKTLNKGNPILEKITTEAKFKTLQEIESYKEKINELSTELGIEAGKDKWLFMGMGDGHREMGMGRWMGK